MPGLCLLRGAALGASWELLNCKSDFASAIHPSTADFLKLLLSAWTTILQNYQKNGEVRRHAELLVRLTTHLQKVLTFLADMKDFKTMYKEELELANFVCVSSCVLWEVI